MPAIWPSPSSPWKRGPRAVGLVPGGMRRKQAARELGVGVGTVRNRAGACRRSGMAALQAGNRDAAQNGRPASAPRRNRNAGDGNDDTEALRRRVEEPEPEDAVMWEVVEVAGKDPGAGLRRLSDRGEDPVDRPVGAGVFARLDDMLARHRAGRPPAAATPGPGLTDTPGCVSGRPGRSPLPRAGTGTAGSRPCPELASRRRRSAGSWPGTGSGRTRPNGAGTVPAGARRLPHPAAWPTGASRPDGRTGSGWRTSPGSGPGTGMACLSPPVDCHDGRIVAHAAGFGPDAELANRMPEEAVATPPGGARPLVHSGRGRQCRWPGWPGLMGRYGLTRSMGAKGRSPGNAAAEGFFGCMRTESVHPGHWEERTRDRGARPGRRLHPLARP